MTEVVYILPLLLTFLILNSIAIFGVNVATEYDVEVVEGYESKTEVIKHPMIAWRLRYYSIKYFGEFYSKPLFTCPPCMASVHSTYFYAFFLSLIGFSWQWLLFYPLYVLILCGLNFIISSKLPH